MRLQDQRPLTVVKTGKEQGNFKAREVVLLFPKCALVCLSVPQVCVR